MRPENPVWGKQRRVGGGSRVGLEGEDLGAGSLCSDGCKPSSQASRNAFNRSRHV